MRSIAPSRPCLIAVALLLAPTLALAAAESPAAPTAAHAAQPADAPSQASAPAPPTFAAATELVTVDVLVVDAQGRPVPGLKRDDFRVSEDGSPQRVTSFEEVAARLAEPAPAALAPSETRIASNEIAPSTRRTFGIVFDDLHVEPAQVGRLRDALQGFLKQETRPGDRLVLLTTAEGRFWTTTRGPGAGRFAAAIAQLESHRRPSQVTPERRMSPVEAMLIMQGDSTVADRVRRRRSILSGWCMWAGGRCQCDQAQLGSTHADGCDEPPGVESAEEAYSLAAQSAERTLSVLRSAITALGAQRDRKVLVLVSQGFLMDPSLDGFRRVRDAAAHANAVLYFLNAGGLETGPFPLSAASGAALPPQDVGPTMVDWRQGADGARTLAADTGGVSLQTNDLVAGLQRVASETRVAYLLGYEPPSQLRDGRYHTLKVEVLRPGLQVRARAGYFAPRGEPSKADDDAVRQAFADPFDRGEIPLRLAAYVQGPSAQAKGRIDVVVAGELRQDALVSRLEGPRQVAEPRLVLMAGAGEREPEKAEWRITVVDTAPANPAKPAEHWYPFATRLPLVPGVHRIRLVVESGTRVGSVTTDVVVPGDQTTRLSTPILSDRLVADSSGRRVMPLARRVFARAATLHCWTELLYAENEKATGVPLVSARFVARSAEGREWAKGAVGAKDAENADPGRLVSIPLAEAPVGENEIVLSVRDEISGRSYEAREPFRVEATEEAQP